MSQSVFIQEVSNLLEETFERHHGIFLDRGTSLLETLDQISAENASRPASAHSASIAAHVRHVTFYMGVLHSYIRNEEVGKINWKEIWQTTSAVTPEEWAALIADLRRVYSEVRATLKSREEWGENEFGGALAIVAHTAYHLGGIRQAWAVVK